MGEGMMIVQGGGNRLLENGREGTVNAIMKVVEKAEKSIDHLSQEGETKLCSRFICWIKATHLLMEGRMD
ncbi:hypothetical protein FHG87_012127 [Trinorchestia longiramus]|nr:hypothetical protein FHG87_012127 [Trinorchestia longiramus]